MEQNTFSEKLIGIKNDIINAINTEVKAALNDKGDTTYIELNKNIHVDSSDFCDTYIGKIEFDEDDRKVVLIDNDDSSYGIEDYRISIWVLAAIGDQLTNKKYKLLEI